ncbi:M23 family metallopeptidase [Acinetobacter sp. 2JN-4]|uniref:M23 family metallopeptidase n=1 Tax=Acinetobacter sp. 2JN-4 TaxID=2479844 RepID=UPI000EF99F6B|nr:M23 family metallopeptidase [Acinetobacter sp. 2JN-4]RLZ10123.1 M23 family metallopeptidase [Acinetobacter sp. 2JN-4]
MLKLKRAFAIGIMTFVPFAAYAAPSFKAPFACGQTWSYSTYSGHNYNALDWVRWDNGPTSGAAVLASAGGTVSVSSAGWNGGAGNMVVINHGNGWSTHYFHLNSINVNVGASIGQGHQIGTVGSTGQSTGAHLHFEQRLNNSAQSIVINGKSLAPYPYSYGQKALTSDNGCSGTTPPPPPTGNKYWVDTWGDANGRSSPGGTVTGTLYKGTHYTYCKVWGPKIQNATGTQWNHWWLKTDLDVGPTNQWVSAFMLSRWGNDEAKDNNGTVIPNCP